VASLREQLAAAGPTYLSHVREVVEQGRFDDLGWGDPMRWVADPH